MGILSSRGFLGFPAGFAAGFLMYTSDLTASIAVIGLIGAGVLFAVVTRHWVIEVFSLVSATIAGALCALTTVVWKRDPTAHNLWPLELLMLSLIMSGLLLLGGGVLVRRYLLHWTLDPRTPASISAWMVPIATIAGIVGYVLIRGAMLDARQAAAVSKGYSPRTPNGSKLGACGKIGHVSLQSGRPLWYPRLGFRS